MPFFDSITPKISSGKRLPFLGLALLLLFTFSPTVRAQYSTTVNNGQVTITFYTGSATVLNVPGTINNMPVVAIGNYAFQSTHVTSVTLPDSVTSLGIDVFSSCATLTSVTLPSGLTTIPAHTFDSCPALTSVNIPAGVTLIDQYAFYGCTSLTTLAIPSGVTTIGDYAFSNCGVPSLTIPNSVTTIGQFTFYGAGLASVNIGTGVTSVGKFAFYSCASLTKATFFGNAPTAGQLIFGGNAGAFKIYYLTGTTSFSNPTWTDSYGDTFPSAGLSAQTINFPTIPDQTTGAATFALNATATSGLSVTYSLVSGPATLSGTNNKMVTVTGIGTVVIQGDQAGDSTHAPAPSVQQSFNVTSAGALSFANWEAQANYFTSGQLADKSISGPSATPQHDAVPNLLKYLYNINPARTMTAADLSALPIFGLTPSGNNTYLTLTYGESPSKTGISVNVETSFDLSTWNRLNNAQYTKSATGTNDANGDPYMQIKVQATAAREFIRLKVTSP